MDVHGQGKVDNRGDVGQLDHAVVNVVDDSALVVEEHVQEPGGQAGAVQDVDGEDGVAPGSELLGGEGPVLVEGVHILVAVGVLVVGPNFVVVLEVEVAGENEHAEGGGTPENGVLLNLETGGVHLIVSGLFVGNGGSFGFTNFEKGIAGEVTHHKFNNYNTNLNYSRRNTQLNSIQLNSIEFTEERAFPYQFIN